MESRAHPVSHRDTLRHASNFLACTSPARSAQLVNISTAARDRAQAGGGCLDVAGRVEMRSWLRGRLEQTAARDDGSIRALTPVGE